jgi:DNA-binding winged helix-turn-helix (wHTH) protein
MIRFGSFVANLRAGELHKNGSRLKLQEQPFKILAMLLERAGDVVTRDELRKGLWPDNTYVDFDHGINMAVGKIREALDDCSEEPKFIETVARRGYRFIAVVESVMEGPVLSPHVFRATPYLPSTQLRSVGRERERAELASAFASVTGGRGVMACVAGEPGIGKTTLVQDFLSGLHVSGKSFDLSSLWRAGRRRSTRHT